MCIGRYRGRYTQDRTHFINQRVNQSMNSGIYLTFTQLIIYTNVLVLISRVISKLYVRIKKVNKENKKYLIKIIKFDNKVKFNWLPGEIVSHIRACSTFSTYTYHTRLPNMFYM